MDASECWVVVYLDDITVSGTTFTEVWERTLAIIARLHAAGFMINLNKCSFLVPLVEMVGHILERDGYVVGDKALQCLMRASLPSMYKEV